MKITLILGPHLTQAPLSYPILHLRQKECPQGITVTGSSKGLLQ
jgi:hypothetical protein